MLFTIRRTWKPLRSLTEHTEVVYAVAFRPNTHELATGSLDKTARIWNADTGQTTHLIKDHAEAVFGVAYSPDGKLLATGQRGDRRRQKLFQTTDYKRVASLTAHQDAVTHVAFNQNGTLLATTSADRQIRIWKVEIGKMENHLRQQSDGDVINACIFDPDGSLLVYGSSNGRVRVFNGDGSNQKQEFKDPEDWVYSVAVGADNQTIAAGTQDGKLLLWDAKQGKTPPHDDVAKMRAQEYGFASRERALRVLPSLLLCLLSAPGEPYYFARRRIPPKPETALRSRESNRSSRRRCRPDARPRF